MSQYKKLSKEIVDTIMSKFKSKDYQKVIKDIKSTKNVEENNGKFRVIISTDTKDRSGEVIKQDGIQFEHFLKNPVVLWAHNYDGLPIGIATDIIKDGNKTIAEGIFAGTKKAQEVRELYDAKVIRAVSVGGIVKEMVGKQITKFELVEFSFVPVPANPEALSLIKKVKLKVLDMVHKGFITVKSVVPKHDPQRADIEMSWDGAAAIDRMRKFFSTDNSGEKDQMEWDKYVDGFTWYNEVEINDFTSYKLPHHDIVDGNFMTVFKGVVAAMSALNGARGGVDVPENDRQKIWDHLADHYKQFDQEPPELKSMDEIEKEKSAKKKKEKKNDKKNKGAVADEMVVDMEEIEKKWENLDRMGAVLWAFYDIYLLNSTPADDFNMLILEVSDLFKGLATLEKANKIGRVQKSIEAYKLLEKHKVKVKNCKYVRALKALKKKEITDEEIGAIMTQLQADVDNLVIVASRELQSLAGEEDKEKRVKKIKKLIELLNKEIRPVDDKGGSKSGEKSGKKKVVNQNLSKKTGLNAYIETREVLRLVADATQKSLENINKKIKSESKN